MNPWATWGLLGAWTVHDSEELFTMVRWTATRVPVLRRQHPWIPARFWRLVSVPNQLEANIAVGGVGLVMAAAAVAGGVSDGRSGFYQAVLVGFGLHSIGHVATAVATRGYTPGVVTAVVLVAPYSAWAWRQLQDAAVTGSFDAGSVVVAVALVPVVIGGARAAGRWASNRAAPRASQGRPAAV